MSKESKEKKGVIEIIPNTPITRKLTAETIKADGILRSANNRMMAGHLDYETHQKIIQEYQDTVAKLTAMNNELTKKLFGKDKKKNKEVVVVEADSEPKPQKSVVA